MILKPIGPFSTDNTLAAYRPPVFASTAYDLKTLVDIGLMLGRVRCCDGMWYTCFPCSLDLNPPCESEVLGIQQECKMLILIISVTDQTF